MKEVKFIGVKEGANVFSLRKEFVLEKAERAVLYATALGVYFAELNGRRVGDAYLAPGWTDYGKLLQMQKYDVTELLREGKNVLELTVGEGWYRSGVVCTRKRYGQQCAVCAELCLEGGVRICTDETWQAQESFIRFSGIYDGEVQDYTAPCMPLTPVAVPYEREKIVPQMCEPVRSIERLPVQNIIHTPKGEFVYDFGQNIAGVVEVKTAEDFCGTLTLQFAEILVGGNFYIENLREAKATDTFTVRGAKTLSPEFTYHGFRYMKLTGTQLPAESVTAVVRHTDMRRTGWIEAENAKFSRLLENVVRGQRGNFVDLPTDCPQRDERLGWTGDINAFCRTAAYNYDVRAVLRKWLADVRNGQATTGEIPHIAPDVLGSKRTSAFWCDAIAMVPWALYRMYGDSSFLFENHEAVKRFIAARERTMRHGLVVRGHEFGDWLALDNEPFADNGLRGRTDEYFITNVMHTETLRIAAETARLLGKGEEEALYAKKREKLLAAMRREYFTAQGRLAFDTVTAQTLALHFHIVPERYRGKLAAMLNENVKKHQYRISTGFIGTPFVLFALADNGYFETAERMLFNEGYPSWLYEVNMGATTVWERWNSLMPDGTPNPDGMNSYNHYAYGSVMEFVYRRVAGIEETEAGFSKVRLVPHPCENVSSLHARFDSVHGTIVSAYERTKDKIIYSFEVPEGVVAEIVLQGEPPVWAGCGKHRYERAFSGSDKREEKNSLRKFFGA